MVAVRAFVLPFRLGVVYNREGSWGLARMMNRSNYNDW